MAEFMFRPRSDPRANDCCSVFKARVLNPGCTSQPPGQLRKKKHTDAQALVPKMYVVLTWAWPLHSGAFQVMQCASQGREPRR